MFRQALAQNQTWNLFGGEGEVQTPEDYGATDAAAQDRPPIGGDQLATPAVGCLNGTSWKRRWWAKEEVTEV